MEKHDFINTFGVPDVDLEIMHCIHHIRKEWEASTIKGVSDHKLSLAQTDILASLLIKGSATSTALSKRLRVSKANLTGMISRLEEKSLVKRCDSQSDGRQKIIELTTQGKKIIERAIPKFILTISSVLSEISDVEKRSLVSNLSLVLDALILCNEEKEEI